MQSQLLEQVKNHALQEMPRESCGLLVLVKRKLQYFPCRNIAEGKEQFAIHPEDYAAAEDMGTITSIVHSHPTTSPEPSQADLVGIEQTNLPWMIINPITGLYGVFEPSGYALDYIGREFIHGTVDCYTLIRDYYQRELNIQLDNYPRADNWWLKGENHYLTRFPEQGFIEVTDLQPHDLILMQIGSPVPNHGAIYLGDNKILHHVLGRYSCRDIYGGYWQKATYSIIRHKSITA